MQSQRSQNWGSVASFHMPRFLKDSKLILFFLGNKSHRVLVVRDERKGTKAHPSPNFHFFLQISAHFKGPGYPWEAVQGEFLKWNCSPGLPKQTIKMLCTWRAQRLYDFGFISKGGRKNKGIFHHPHSKRSLIRLDDDNNSDPRGKLGHLDLFMGEGHV